MTLRTVNDPMQIEQWLALQTVGAATATKDSGLGDTVTFALTKHWGVIPKTLTRLRFGGRSRHYLELSKMRFIQSRKYMLLNLDRCVWITVINN